jgi:hypothetical protein
MSIAIRRVSFVAVAAVIAACQAPGITHLVPERFPATTAARVIVIPEERKPACAYTTIAEIAEGERQQQDRWLWPEELPAFTQKAASIGADAIWIQAGRVRDLGQVRQGDSDQYVRTRMVINYVLALKWNGVCP